MIEPTISLDGVLRKIEQMRTLAEGFEYEQGFDVLGLFAPVGTFSEGGFPPLRFKVWGLPVHEHGDRWAIILSPAQLESEVTE